MLLDVVGRRRGGLYVTWLCAIYSTAPGWVLRCVCVLCLMHDTDIDFPFPITKQFNPDSMYKAILCINKRPSSTYCVGEMKTRTSCDGPWVALLNLCGKYWFFSSHPIAMVRLVFALFASSHGNRFVEKQKKKVGSRNVFLLPAFCLISLRLPFSISQTTISRGLRRRQHTAKKNREWFFSTIFFLSFVCRCKAGEKSESDVNV